MKNKVLKLSKRMGKFTIEEIIPILMADKMELMPVIDELLAENLLILNPNGFYFYNEIISIKPTHPMFLECRTPEETELLIKCFSVGLDSKRTGVIVGLDRNSVSKFNAYLRKNIYEKQYKELIKCFENMPYTPRIRQILDKTVYFYYYNNKTYVSEKKLNSKYKEHFLPRSEDKKFRIDFLKLSRRQFRNTLKNNIHHHLAELLVRIYSKDEYIPIQLLTEMVKII